MTQTLHSIANQADLLTPGPLRIAGYAALFGRADGARDIIEPGAFARTIAARGSNPFPLNWQHKPEQRIGWVEKIAEDKRGLRIIAQIDNPFGRAAEMLRRRAVNGLSFGYRAKGFRHEGSNRILSDIELYEISVVTHPLQSGARVHLII